MSETKTAWGYFIVIDLSDDRELWRGDARDEAHVVSILKERGFRGRAAILKVEPTEIGD